jgi:alpha-D-xyloside xylohydrolase
MMERYFAPALPPVSLSIKGADGSLLARMSGWKWLRHRQWREDLQGRRHLLHRGGEHFWGLGQNQRGLPTCAAARSIARHNYDAPAGEPSACPSWSPTRATARSGASCGTIRRALVWPGLHGKTHFVAGERVSFS